MEITAGQKIPLQGRKNKWKPCFHNNISHTRIRHYKVVVLLVLLILLLLSVLLVYLYQSDAYAASAAASQNCSLYRIKVGDTLSNIAVYNHTTIPALAQANHLSNANLIIAGKLLCLPQSVIGTSTCTHSIQQNSAACRSSYPVLQFSSQGEVTVLLRQAAGQYSLPINLLYAIAWQESGWNQHVISPDGGIGVLQIMPYTATELNIMAGSRLNPYRLYDNINLGAFYLHTLWIEFHGNLPQVISAYNEGGWNVIHRGIFNWQYVNNVLALMQRYR